MKTKCASRKPVSFSNSPSDDKLQRDKELVANWLTRPDFEQGYEFHLPYHNYTGPGTHTARRIMRGDEPVSYLDHLSLHHDMDYYLDAGSSSSTADDTMTRRFWPLWLKPYHTLSGGQPERELGSALWNIHGADSTSGGDF